MKMTTLAVAALATLATALPAAADWRRELPVLRVGILSGENEADRLRRTSCMRDLLAERLGVQVQMFPATDYAGVMQGLLAGQLDMAGLGAVGYAGIYLQDPEAVMPVFTNSNVDGSLGYFSVIVTRADSGITDLEGLRGKTLAWADPNSASGFLYPKAGLELQGVDIDTFFRTTGFSGGHEQGVLAVLNGQYDAAATWTSLMGEKETGFTRGNLRRMVGSGLLNMNDINIAWVSGIIPNGPTVVRKALPQEARDIINGIYARLHIDNPECYLSFSGGEGDGYRAISHDFYAETVEMRRREVAASR